MAAWKSLERSVAKSLNGKRNLRGGDFSRSASDVEHPLFAIECKYRKTLPRLLRLGLDQAKAYDQDKTPILVVKEKHQRGALVVMHLSDFEDLLGSLTPVPDGELGFHPDRISQDALQPSKTDDRHEVRPRTRT